LEEAGRVDIVAGSDQDVIPDDDRGRRGEISLGEIGDGLVPALLAGAGIQRDQVIVRRLHEEIVVPHGEPAVADVRAAPGLPVVVPELAAVARVHRPRVVRHGEVEGSVDREDGGLDRAAADRDIAWAFAADDYVSGRSAASTSAAARSLASRARGDARRPGE